jgi:phosphoglycerate dehydrogenase-like enzyme
VNRQTPAAPRRRLAVLSPVKILPELLAVLDAAPLDWIEPPSRDQDGVRRVVREADVVLADFTGQLRLDTEEAAVGTRVAFIQQIGAGVETIDLSAWAQRGVPVANTAGANANGVAEWCVASAIVLLRSMIWADVEMRSGRWPRAELVQRGLHELASRRVGIVGLGPVGRACAIRFGAFGCRVSYWSRHRRPSEEEHGATYRPLDDLIRTSDVLLVALALTEQTRGIIDGSRLALLPHGAIVINAARGGIVDEDALTQSVEAGALLGAGLDVFASEPLPPDSPLRRSDRILLSPHAAGGSSESRAEIMRMIAANLEHAVQGEPLESVVNGVTPVVRWPDSAGERTPPA